MKTLPSISAPTRFISGFFAAALLLGGTTLPLMAQAPKSVLPAFGTEGTEFTTKAQSGHTLKGWLPKDWSDNTEWAQVTATYTKLTDSPDKAAGAVRIKVAKVDDGQLQLTSYQGLQKFKKGTKYVVTGWLRSSDSTGVKIGVRQKAEPYEFYHEEDLSTANEWKRFEFKFTPTAELDAFLMFVVNQVGTVDLAGVVVEEKA